MNIEISSTTALLKCTPNCSFNTKNKEPNKCPLDLN